MTQPSTIAQRFLSNPSQLGVVAVGFNGGQVRFARRQTIALQPWKKNEDKRQADSDSANWASKQPPRP